MDSNKANIGTFYLTIPILVLTAIAVGIMAWNQVFLNTSAQAPPIDQRGAWMSGWLPIFIVASGLALSVVLQVFLGLRLWKTKGLRSQVTALTKDLTSEKNATAEANRKYAEANNDKLAAENERDGLRARLEGATNEIQSLTTKLEAAREESYEATKRAKFAEQQSEARDKLFQDRENQLGHLLWLRKRMEDQAKDISEHVIVRKSKLYDLRLDSERCVIVVLTIRNESLFDVTIDFGKVSGCLFFNTTARHDPAHVLTKHSPPIMNLEPMVQSEIVIEQPLLRTESEIISESLQDQTARFWLGNLNIPISVTNIPQTVQSKPLRLGENVEYLYLKDYNNDPLEKVYDGEKLTIPEIRRRIDRLPPAERVRATQAALQLWGESFYQPD